MCFAITTAIQRIFFHLLVTFAKWNHRRWQPSGIFQAKSIRPVLDIAKKLRIAITRNATLRATGGFHSHRRFSLPLPVAHAKRGHQITSEDDFLYIGMLAFEITKICKIKLFYMQGVGSVAIYACLSFTLSPLTRYKTMQKRFHAVYVSLLYAFYCIQPSINHAETVPCYISTVFICIVLDLALYKTMQKRF